MLELNPNRSAVRRLGAGVAHTVARLALHGADWVGARPTVHGRPYVENLGRLWIGDDVEICATPVRSHLVTGPRGYLHIGHGVSIGAGAAISAQDRVEIGEGAHLDPFVMILDADYHDAADRDAPGAAAPILIGAHAFIGDHVTILRGATIGAYARIEPGSVVSGVIPERAVASGVPARVRRAAGDAPPDLLDRIQRIAAEVFALPDVPAPARGPKDIPGWDSLGALRLLVTLEDDLHISLPPDALAKVADLAGLAALVARAARH